MVTHPSTNWAPMWNNYQHVTAKVRPYATL